MTTTDSERTTYSIWVAPEGPFDEYVDSTTDALGHALIVLEEMGKMPGMKSQGQEFVFSDADELRIEDDDGCVIKTWSRERGVIVDQVAERDDANVVGWQILNSDGYNIHGDNDDPFGLTSFAILVGDAANSARSWVKDNPGYSVGPVKAGDIEEPEYVSAVSIRRSPAFT